ncbi:sensor histidine kinase [Gynurincola endophyticus]|uniref:sensor histidine kinase n=1 Tax=Gynurincola endophyticus TaxID=2479004 RepID=UPI000F8DBE14|nr:HAMP domain-containing sensor histidine kinase [Gynurincola endophyticus]
MKTRIFNFVRKNVFLVISIILLLITVGIIQFNEQENSAVAHYQGRIQKEIYKKEQVFADVVANSETIHALAQQAFTEEKLKYYLQENLEIGIYVYEISPEKELQLKFWNTQQMLPKTSAYDASNVPRLVTLENGFFVRLSQTVYWEDQIFKVIGLIPVQWKYFVENANLRKNFEGFSRAIDWIDLTTNITDYPVHSREQDNIFYLYQHHNSSQHHTAGIVIIWAVVFFLFCLQVHQWAHRIYLKKNLTFAASILLLIIFVLRIFLYWCTVYFSINQFELFDPSVYGSSLLLSSLGDLLIHVLLGCWLILFINRRIDYSRIKVYSKGWMNLALYLTLLFSLVIYSFLVADLIQSLVADAKISFNVTNFFSLSIYSLLGFLILAVLTVGYFFGAHILIKLSKYFEPAIPFIIYGVIAFFGLAVLSAIRNNEMIELNLMVLLWLLLFVALIKTKWLGGMEPNLTNTQMLIWLFVFSVSMSVLIVFENKKIELDQRKRFAEKLAQQSDPSSERLLSITLTYLDNNFLYPNFKRFQDPVINAYLKDSIINKSFSAYLNKYDTRIYTFDSSFHVLHNEDNSSYDVLNTIYQIQGKKTLIPDLKYYERAYDKYTYIFRREVIDDNDVPVGYFFVISDPKRYKADALVPELFKQSRELTPEYAPNYSYAVYSGGKLLNYVNDYAFPTSLRSDQLPKEEFSTNNQGEYTELWYKHSGDRIVVIAIKTNTILETITLFAYLFSTFLVLLLGYRLLSILLRSRFQYESLNRYFQVTIRTQIHGVIIMVSVFSFLIIAVVTILFFINRYQRDNQDRLSRASQLMVTEVEKQVNRFRLIDIIGTALFDKSYEFELENLVGEISEVHGTDVNLYDTLGKLRVSSNPDIYQRGVVSDMMNPLAFYRLQNLRQVQTVTDEKIGAVDYQSIYSPVRDDAGRAVAYLNTPSFNTQSELKQEISNFLVTIINLNAFVFLVAGLIAVFITNRITRSFSLIAERMREVTLSKMNEEIVWNRNDEIGVLVKEYNRMVLKLTESADALAKSEREGAWRQMARQVAHEIKNPLTPMKLSIQYLQKAIDDNHPNVKDLTRNVANTLVEQIDHLSKIASDFSQFANIGVAKKEVFDLHEVLQSLTHLYQTNEAIVLNWQPLNEALLINADKTQINRLFTNLLQNAVEAIAENDFRKIDVKEVHFGEDIIVSIQDNGKGIPVNMGDKIFTPNFTTKSSGTGLGLAMCKSIAEQSNGDIWFETHEGQGTVFFVRLPLLPSVG